MVLKYNKYMKNNFQALSTKSLSIWVYLHISLIVLNTKALSIWFYLYIKQPTKFLVKM